MHNGHSAIKIVYFSSLKPYAQERWNKKKLKWQWFFWGRTKRLKSSEWDQRAGTSTIPFEIWTENAAVYSTQTPTKSRARQKNERISNVPQSVIALYLVVYCAKRNLNISHFCTQKCRSMALIVCVCVCACQPSEWDGRSDRVSRHIQLLIFISLCIIKLTQSTSNFKWLNEKFLHMQKMPLPDTQTALFAIQTDNVMVFQEIESQPSRYDDNANGF